MLVVWEPILMTDWRPPSSSVLARVSDNRVRQFWDPTHLVTADLARIARKNPGLQKPDCCVKTGFHWDEAALYAPITHWSDAPTPLYWNGPVFRVAPALETAWNEQH